MFGNQSLLVTDPLIHVEAETVFSGSHGGVNSCTIVPKARGVFDLLQLIRFQGTTSNRQQSPVWV